MDRRERVLRGLDLKRLVGVEIGPLANPMVRKSDGTVIYVDYADTQSLRLRYSNDPHVDIAQIVDIDAIWGERTMLDVLDGRLVNYIIASHVIEHVPDLITWLQELHSVLLPQGEVRLVIPDKRYTFDYLRAETRLCDVVSTYLLRARVPQPREIIDFCVNKVRIDVIKAWQGDVNPDHLLRDFTFEGALWLAKDVIDNGTYHDVHCWVFTPNSFARLCTELAKNGLLAFACKEYCVTERNQLEFFVTLEKSADKQKVLQSWSDMVRRTLPNSRRGGFFTFQRKH